MRLKSSQPLLITLTRPPSPCTYTTGLSYHNADMPGALASCPGRGVIWNFISYETPTRPNSKVSWLIERSRDFGICSFAGMT